MFLHCHKQLWYLGATLSVRYCTGILLCMTLLHTCCVFGLDRNWIINHSDIIVPHGRSVYLDPSSHLTIRQSANEKCSVTVLQNDPLSQQAGKLHPSKFPCNFGLKDVKYTHYGLNFPTFDKVQLLVRLDSESSTQIIPLTLTFAISFHVPLQVVSLNTPLVVRSSRSSSNAIQISNTQLSYDRDNLLCKTSVFSGVTNLPKYGYIFNRTSDLSNVFDCDVFLGKIFTYQFTGNIGSLKEDFIPLVVRLFEKDGTLVTQENFIKVVRIEDGKENTPPQVDEDALLAIQTTKGGLDVNQFILTPITSKVLSATDVETNSGRLIFNVTRPLGPNEGEIVSTDNQFQPIHSFYQNDIFNFKIAYKPPSDDSNIPRTFELSLEVIDENGKKSDTFLLMIIVNPKQTLAPIVTKNHPLELYEGQSRTINSEQYLKISDEDDLHNVRISVVDGLRHGTLSIPGGRQFFTPEDLDQGTITYQHDGTDTEADNIIFHMTDSKHNVEFLFPIIIFPVDDEPAILTVNLGLEIKKNDIVPITMLILSATDIDSDDSSIEFVLLPPYSREGVILKRQFERPSEPSQWQKDRGVYQKPVERFFQRDITNNKIFYKHIGTHKSTVVIDKIRFSLRSGTGKKTTSDTYEFLVKVHPIDDQSPDISPDTQLNMTVNEFKLTPFKRRNLHYTDSDTKESQLKYHITRSPFDLDSYVHTDAGQIVMCDQPSLTISDFQQGEVFHHKICYKPPSTEQGLIERRIQFYFDVEDSNGNILANQHFTIIVVPVNNQPPIVTNMGVTVLENRQVVITTQVLDIQDPDTDPTLLTFNVVKLPEHGDLFKGRQLLQVSDQFSYIDLFSGNIVYKCKSTDSDTDMVSLEVTDGAHKVPIGLRVNIKHIREKPILDLNGRKRLTLNVEVDEGGSFVLSSELIRMKNVVEPKLVTFHVKSRALQGSIVLDNWPTNMFTYQDIMDEKVKYRHQGPDVGYDGATDKCILMLSNNEDRNSEVTLNIKILPIDNISPKILQGATFSVYEGEKGLILPRHLDVIDDDTKDEYIQCLITVQPTYGFVENLTPGPGSEKSRAGMTATAFHVKDIRLGNINYVQSDHTRKEPKSDQFSFKCTDGTNTSPEEKTFQISIFPRNDEIPVVHIREFIVMEGLELKIDSPILSAEDKDIPSDEITFIISTFPKHGQVVRQQRSGIIPTRSFTMSEIAKSSPIMYQHDNTESFNDLIEFIVTDGVHNVTQSIPIVIIPVDDETPRLTVNTGLEIKNVGERKLISNDVLKAEDLDSHNPDIMFIIRRYPSEGYFIKQKGNKLENMTYHGNFTQYEIDSNQIYYVHTGSEGKRDIVKFDVTDGLNPLIDRYFYITIKGIDLTYPEVYNKGIQLPEGGTIKLTTDIIRGRDIDSPDAMLIFRVTKIPAHGYLYNTDNPNQPITTFTQLDLAGSKICYTHNALSEIKMDAFQFEVTDGQNTVKRTFRIAITDVDNKKPTLVFDTLYIAEGGNKLITPFELRAIDEDTIDVNIEFVVTQLPVHGNILFNLSKVVTMFTYQDIKNNLITYQHDGTETSHDAFSFTVTDGVHSDFFIFSAMDRPTRQPQTIPIEIMPVDNGIPYLKINKGLQKLTHLDSDAIGDVISEQLLLATDRDSDIPSLTFTLCVPPKHGYIRVGNVKANSWTQADITRGVVEYILNPGEDATEDTFFFKIQDQGGNELSNQPFHVQWCWISFQQKEYQVAENEKLLEITVNRRGYLHETVYVDITAEDGTARVYVDFGPLNYTMQFNPGQTEKKRKIHLVDNTRYEGTEYFTLRLVRPVMAVLESSNTARVIITDQEDESVIRIPAAEYKVTEDAREVSIPIHRSGDLMDEFMVVCCTKSGTAMGTSSDVINSGADFVSRSNDHRSTIRFDVGEDMKYCKIQIIDDSLYEEDENFMVILMEPMGGRLGDNNVTTVVIQADPADEPKFSFSAVEYRVDERAGSLAVMVIRTGSDLSKPASVTVRSRQTDPISAEVGDDYVGVNKILSFPAGVSERTLDVTIIDDLGQPTLEGPERYRLELKMPMGGFLGETSLATVVIDDTKSDAPLMEFEDTVYYGQEKDGQMTAVIIRHGDITHDASVRCYTRQNTAIVDVDYVERTDTDLSVVYFAPGQRKAKCVVDLIDDKEFEEVENFRLVLGTPTSSTTPVALVGEKNSTILMINNAEDEPAIEIPDRQYVANEPIIENDITLLRVPVIRTGDLSGLSEVNIMSKDGSAEAGRDYNGFHKALVFSPGVSEIEVVIQILYDNIKENRETFIILLTQDKYNLATVKNSRAMIYIEENSKMADVVFPTKPIVVSLKDYDDVSGANNLIMNGYPVVCVSPCNPRHPEYRSTEPLCKQQEINDKLTKFQWQVAAPTTPDGVASPLRDIVSNAFFATTRGITLDSVYFNSGSRIRCIARAVNHKGEPGHTSDSEPVKVNGKLGICPPVNLNSVGAEPFSAKMKYLGPKYGADSGKVLITVTIPHQDGMLPVVATAQPTNFEYLVSADAYRQGNYPCSNMKDFSESGSDFGFISNRTRNLDMMSEIAPYQNSVELRTEETLRFYSNLDYESCLWRFQGVFDMTSLVTQCEGQIASDGQPLDIKQSFLTMRVPLYVSSVFHSIGASGGWRHIDAQTELELTFVYNTAKMWSDGIGSLMSADAGSIEGSLFPSSMKIINNRLVVQFRTEARFRGQFVKSHQGSEFQSTVTCVENPKMTFTLRLLRSSPSIYKADQLWKFESDYSMKDYSGLYKISLVPCTTSSQSYSPILSCEPQQPIVFDLPIRFQQVSDPVPEKYTLDTKFRIMRKRELWLSKDTGQMQVDNAFLPGDTLYGRIDSSENLGEKINLGIDKVFLCTGKDGYIPRYDPNNNLYGCLGPKDRLEHKYKILDPGAPDTVDTEVDGQNIKAVMANDDPGAGELTQQPGADGFYIDTQPLFQTDSDRVWFLHSIYSLESSRQRRDLSTEEDNINQPDTGTNMIWIRMRTEPQADDYNLSRSLNNKQAPTTLMPILIGVSILLIIILIVLIVLIRRHKKRSSPPPSPTSTITVMDRKGKVMVVHLPEQTSCDQKSEV